MCITAVLMVTDATVIRKFFTCLDVNVSSERFLAVAIRTVVFVSSSWQYETACVVAFVHDNCLFIKVND